MTVRQFAAVPRRFLASAVTLILLAAGVLVGLVQSAQVADAALPAGFGDTVVMSGMKNPTIMQFAPDGTILIGLKSGKIYSYKSLTDGNPTLVADLSTQVDDYWDRGLLGLAVPPNYPTDNHLYVLYTRDALPGGDAPHWNDVCPTIPGPVTDGCVVTGRLSKLTLTSGVLAAASDETPLITDWCQQFPSHSIGDVMFGNDGYLYAAGGDGSAFNGTDYGQFGATNPGDQANPCGDPPGGVGVAPSPPSSEGGALRAQSALRTDANAVLGGSLIRVDTSGNAVSTNPNAASADVDKARILAFGFRNPFRFTTRPGTNQLWIGDVGDGSWEEIDKVPDTTATTTALNFGWPCYEGVGKHGSWQNLGLTQCENLFSNPSSLTPPVFSYDHGKTLTTDDTCPIGSSDITGIAFYGGTSYPSSLHNALFFADHSRQCMWALLPDANGNPDPANVLTLGHFAHPVQIVAGPAAYNKDLFYVDMDDGTVHRLTYTAGAQPPTAVAKVTPTSGTAPLTVSYDGTSSTDPQGQSLTYSWDFGDGATSTSASGTHVYTKAGSYNAKLTVMDTGGLTNSATAAVQVNGPPTAVAKVTPTTGATPLNVAYDGTASTDPQNQALTYSWDFGDGASSTSASGTHTYTNAGTYTAKLTVKDTSGLTNTASAPSVTVNPASSAARITSMALSVKSPTGATRTKYRVGDSLNYSANAVDSNNAALPASAFTWRLTVHQCLTATNCRTSVAATRSGVKSGTFAVPDKTAPIYLTVDLTVTPPGSTPLTGVLTTQSDTVGVRFVTNQTTSLKITVDGIVRNAPFTVTMVMGHKASVTATSPQTIAGHKYTYTSWSDKGALTHTITAPTAATTRTANYKRA